MKEKDKYFWGRCALDKRCKFHMLKQEGLYHSGERFPSLCNRFIFFRGQYVDHTRPRIKDRCKICCAKAKKMK